MSDDATIRETAESRPRDYWRPVVLIVAVVAILIWAEATGVSRRLANLREWIRSFGAFGPAVYVLVYVASTVVAIPVTPLTVAAGAMYGWVFATFLISIASLLGASASFLVARYFARDAVTHWLSRNARFREIDRLTEEHGIIIVALARLVPILPFTLVNYAFGLTSVRFWTYAWWTWLCLLPANVLYVVGADAVARGLAEERIPWLLVCVFVFFILLTAILVRYARGRLKASTAGAGNRNADAPKINDKQMDGADTTNP
ncbi:MAG: TVP38/TMEM64 family protein [Candidatus Sumerlaeia bacterium]|nr:TVP38/TMEM64 family protein [Candidatus Sumerlaeia bacterium]